MVCSETSKLVATPSKPLWYPSTFSGYKEPAESQEKPDAGGDAQGTSGTDLCQERSSEESTKKEGRDGDSLLIPGSDSLPQIEEVGISHHLSPVSPSSL